MTLNGLEWNFYIAITSDHVWLHCFSGSQTQQRLLLTECGPVWAGPPPNGGLQEISWQMPGEHNGLCCVTGVCVNRGSVWRSWRRVRIKPGNVKQSGRGGRTVVKWTRVHDLLHASWISADQIGVSVITAGETQTCCKSTKMKPLTTIAEHLPFFILGDFQEFWGKFEGEAGETNITLIFILTDVWWVVNSSLCYLLWTNKQTYFRRYFQDVPSFLRKRPNRSDGQRSEIRSQTRITRCCLHWAPLWWTLDQDEQHPGPHSRSKTVFIHQPGGETHFYKKPPSHMWNLLTHACAAWLCISNNRPITTDRNSAFTHNIMFHLHR